MDTPPPTMKFQSVLRLVLFVVFMSFLCPNQAEEVSFSHQHHSRPNIVFIMADDLGYNDVSYHNKKGAYTPTIDKLAREGIRLENYYVQPICSPSRGQFLSGRSQIHTGLQHKNIRRTQPNALPRDSLTLPDKLKEAGYATDMVGKWHLGFYHKDYLPTSRGFDTFYGMYLGSGGHFSHRARSGRKNLLDLHNDTATEQRPDFKQDKVYSTHLFTDEAIRIIKHRAREENPFFLYLSYQAVHGPLQVPTKYSRIVGKKLQRKNIGDTRRRKFVAMTYAMDRGVQRVVDSLKSSGVWNNTILVFATDNGGVPGVGGSNLPLKGRKGTFYEGGVRGIGLVNSPLFANKYANSFTAKLYCKGTEMPPDYGYDKGYVNKEMIHVTDWFPTFVSLANGNLNGTRNVNGFNQWKTLSFGAPSPREEILFNIDPMTKSRIRNYHRHAFDVRVLAALRKGDYKIITGRSKAPGVSLYNIKDDPLEEYDLAELKVFKPKVNELLDILQAHQKTAVPVRFPKSNRPRFVDSWGPWDYTIVHRRRRM